MIAKLTTSVELFSRMLSATNLTTLSDFAHHELQPIRNAKEQRS
jgi:hypothetical protein